MPTTLTPDYNELYDSLTKCATLNTALQPHQQRVVDRIRDQSGLVVAHGLGTGKTLSSIAAADALGLPTTVVVPAALQANYHKELERHRKQKSEGIDVSSLQRITRGAVPPDLSKQLLIVDEAHRLREPTSTGRQVFNKLTPHKRLLLTASPIYNHPADLASLVNLAAGEHLIPTDRAGFEKAYTKKEISNPGILARIMGAQKGERKVLTNTKQLKTTLNKWVDYHEGGTTDFPSSSTRVIKVPMSSIQQDVNDGLLNKAPFWIRYKIRHGLPPSKQESHQLNAFLGMQRQVSNSPQAYREGMPIAEAVKHSPKIQAAFRNFQTALSKNKRHKAVVYSNYLQSGLNPYKHLLDQHKIPYGVFSGEMPKAERAQMVKDYNDNKLKALLISSAGAEGLDLKGTRQIQILDPHFNDEKINQVTGRGIRFRSHAHLKPAERHVDVEHYLSTNRPTLLSRFLREKNTAADEYIYQGAKKKTDFNTQFVNLLKPPKKPELQR